MRAPEEKILIDGPAGKIDVIMERPDAPRGIALVAHPHPIGGGANTNPVAYTLARTFVSLGYAAFRPNFRGVGDSEGVHDEGHGETEDLLAVLNDAKCRCGNLPVALAVFSFGAFCQTRLARRLVELGHPAQRLVRTRIGDLSDHSLAPGEWRALTADEVRGLEQAIARGRSAPSE